MPEIIVPTGTAQAYLMLIAAGTRTAGAAFRRYRHRCRLAGGMPVRSCGPFYLDSAAGISNYLRLCNQFQ